MDPASPWLIVLGATLIFGVISLAFRPRRILLAIGETRLSATLTDTLLFAILLAAMILGRQFGDDYDHPLAGLVVAGLLAMLVNWQLRRPVARVMARLVGRAR